MITHTDIINDFIKKYNFKSYLEIGIHNKEDNFNKIKCENKIGIDPDENAKADYVITSDEFFKNNKNTFDIIFIDGMHEAHQVYKDITNSIKVLNKNGIIVCHDCNPLSLKAAGDYEEFSKCEYGSYCWNGDCWKGFVKYRFESNFKCYVIDTDCGCGIINTNEPSDVEKKTFYIGEMVYSDLVKDRKGLLGLI